METKHFFFFVYVRIIIQTNFVLKDNPNFQCTRGTCIKINVLQRNFLYTCLDLLTILTSCHVKRLSYAVVCRVMFGRNLWIMRCAAPWCPFLLSSVCFCITYNKISVNGQVGVIYSRLEFNPRRHRGKGCNPT